MTSHPRPTHGQKNGLYYISGARGRFTVPSNVSKHVPACCCRDEQTRLYGIINGTAGSSREIEWPLRARLLQAGLCRMVLSCAPVCVCPTHIPMIWYISATNATRDTAFASKRAFFFVCRNVAQRPKLSALDDRFGCSCGRALYSDKVGAINGPSQCRGAVALSLVRVGLCSKIENPR